MAIKAADARLRDHRGETARRGQAQGDKQMYKNLLIATDGSELAGKAVTHGLELAKALGAKVTAVIVSEPWTVFATGEVGASFPVDEYERAIASQCVPGARRRRRSRQGGRRPLRDEVPEGPVPRRRHHCSRQRSRMRSDRHGLARPQRRAAAPAWQPGEQGSDPQPRFRCSSAADGGSRRSDATATLPALVGAFVACRRTTRPQDRCGRCIILTTTQRLACGQLTVFACKGAGPVIR